MMKEVEAASFEDRLVSAKVRSTGCLRVVVGLFAAVLAAGTTPAAAQPVDLEEWVEARTASFVVRSDAAPERAGEITQTLQVFRSAFAGLSPELNLRSPVPTRILAFRNEASFSAFKSGQEARGSRILGQFLTHPDGNFITLNADPRLFGGFGVVLHEYVHYLVSHNFPGVPRWFNEGLAEYYSTFVLEGEYAIIGRPVQRHLDWLRRYGRLDVAEVLEVGHASGRHSEVDAGHFYAVSWGLVHYLLSSSPELGSRLAVFLSEAGDPAPSRRFEDIFDLRLEELESELERYLLADGPPAGSVPLAGLNGTAGARVGPASPADVLNDLGALMLRLGDEAAAGRLYDLAAVYEPENGDAYAGLAHIRDIEQRLEEADILFEQALEFGPRDARSYLLYGRHLLARLDEARRAGEAAAAARFAKIATQAFQRALDLSPDFAEASALLGYTHLFGDLDPKDGVVHLERALEALPGRVDLYFHLLQLEVRHDEIERARALAAGPIRRLGGEEWGLRADEEVDRVSYLRAADAALREGRTEEGLDLLSQAIAVTSDLDLRARMEANLERLQERLESQQRNGIE
jgi:tetratricopeptide (TPR) repeat protein